LTILTTDFTIITKLLAKHVSGVLPLIINQDQSAYIKGRYTGENIRTITDIMDYCKVKNMSAVLLLIDFEKAFDTVKWSFLDEALTNLIMEIFSESGFALSIPLLKVMYLIMVTFLYFPYFQRYSSRLPSLGLSIFASG
jgi:hypothetical protein